jgi:type I restriction enzyme, S subunit
MASRGDINIEEIVPVLPEMWAKLRFDEVLDKNGGFTKLRSDMVSDDGHFPVIDQGDKFISGYVDDTSLLYKGNLPIIIFGDHTRVVKYVDFEFAVGADGTKILRPKSTLVPKFFYYYVNCLNVPSLGYSRHYKILKSVPVPVPPIHEQKRIVAKLDTLFTHLNQLKTRLEKIPELLKQFRQAVLTQAVTGKFTEEWRVKNEVEPWNKIQFDNVADIIDPHPSHRTPPPIAGGAPYIGIGDLTESREIDFENARKVSAMILDEHKKRYKLRAGDFIFGKIGTIGRPIVIPETQTYTLSANVILIQPNHKFFEPKFLFFYLDSPELAKLVNDDTKSTSQPAYGIKKMRKLNVPLPSLKEQQIIVRKAESLFAVAKRIEASYKTLQDKIGRLPQAILSKAFRGELLNAQEVNDEVHAIAAETETIYESLK